MPLPSKSDLAHDILAAGIIAAALFIKNPAKQEHAANILTAVTPLIALIEAQTHSAVVEQNQIPPSQQAGDVPSQRP